MDMNKIKAKLLKVEGDDIKLLTFSVDEDKIRVLGVDNYELKDYILEVNPSKLFLSSTKFNYENRLEVIVEKIDNIKDIDVLASVQCRYKEFLFEVLMIKELINFSEGDKVYLYFKASDVFIEEVIEDIND